jgi:hypothetical protein
VKPAASVREGFVPFHGLRTWYRVVGEAEEAGRQPLALVHGAPGFPHDPSLWSVGLCEANSHAPHLEEPERFLAAVAGFLRKVEEGAA